MKLSKIKGFRADRTKLGAKIDTLWVHADPVLVEIARMVDSAHAKYKPGTAPCVVPEREDEE